MYITLQVHIKYKNIRRTASYYFDSISQCTFFISKLLVLWRRRQVAHTSWRSDLQLSSHLGYQARGESGGFVGRTGKEVVSMAAGGRPTQSEPLCSERLIPTPTKFTFLGAVSGQNSRKTRFWRNNNLFSTICRCQIIIPKMLHQINITFFFYNFIVWSLEGCTTSLHIH